MKLPAPHDEHELHQEEAVASIRLADARVRFEQRLSGASSTDTPE